LLVFPFSLFKNYFSKNNLAFINSIGLSNALFKHAQKDIADFILKRYKVPFDDIDKISRLFERSEIISRFSAIQDFSLDKEDWTFFEKETMTSIEMRMKKFFEIAPQLGLNAVNNCIPKNELKSITHLITVSCTGISAPGLDIQMIQLLKLPSSIHRTSINFMGCYAAIHALKQANAICQSNRHAKVLIVDIELCTLHFQDTYTMDNVAASLLFADGAAAVLVSNERGIYSIENFYAEVALEGYNDMAWNISSSGFLMTLSAYVPTVIAENIKPMLLNSLSQMNIQQEHIKHWAIHPGGKKIVSEIEKALSLSKEDVAVSRSVLSEYGNMSSVTILYVLEKIRQQIKHKDESIYSVAFGPGLTIESMFLKSC
jgi:predicted naringenin-chalcone synthase